jgi:hypothetical protein
MSTWNLAPLIIHDLMCLQARAGEFICRRCRNWGGGISCARNCFITAKGCNTEGCEFFALERREGMEG